MKFNSLKEKCEYFRSLTDYKLLPNSYVLVMCDGRSFSKLIKNKFEKPFDDKFIHMMNEVAKHVCSHVEGVKFAYTQSDEISFVITDFDTPTTEPFFSNRLCKMQSIIASLCSVKFNQLLIEHYVHTTANVSTKDLTTFIKEKAVACFDCKVWNVPNVNEVFSWFLYRQIDCIRNSKQQTAQTWLSHKELMNKDTDTQIAILKEKTGIDWHCFDDDKKYGRFIYKVKEQYHNDKLNMDYERNVWKAFPAFPLMEEGNKDRFFAMKLFPICQVENNNV